MMKYKGYVGKVEYDSNAKLFHGEVIQTTHQATSDAVGLKDVITFQGKTVNELEKAFKDSINDYLEWCEERNEMPEKPYSGKLQIRLTPELHAQLAQEAYLKGKSLNSFIIEKLRN